MIAMRVSVVTVLLAAACGGSSVEPDAPGFGGAVPDAVTDTVPAAPVVSLPKEALDPSEVAVVINDADPQSVAVGEYYRERRGIPAGNVVHLDFSTGDVLDPTEFATVKADLDAALDSDIQALALTWALPYRVGCMSVTSAFALGFSTSFCSTPCNPTAAVALYDSDTAQPFTDLGIRPAMALASASEEDAFALIDRGIASDGTFPTGDGYLVRTTDVARSVRWPEFIETVALFSHEGGLDLTYVDNSAGGGSDVISGTGDVLFYFTGLAMVPEIDTNTYLPGAVADHLTSYGGQIPTGGQMSVQDWLTAGATASFGTVVEPCNYPTKFPDTTVMLPRYFRGATVIEAYWKSVQWPGEGLFVGEPLARPWGGSTVSFDAATLTLTIETNFLDPNRDYELQAADAAEGPYEAVLGPISVPEYRRTTIDLDNATAPFYRLVERE